MLERLLGRSTSTRAAGLTSPDYQDLFTRFGFNGVQYVAPNSNLAALSALEGANNPIVAACIHLRAMVFAEVRFTYQAYAASRPGSMYGTQSLIPLEVPWPGANTGDLLGRMEIDASLYGNSFWIKYDDGLVRLDPMRVVIATGSVEDPTTGRTVGHQLAGYYLVDDHGGEVAFFEPSEVAHYRPLPDPKFSFRGASWLSSVLQDVQVDGQLSDYKSAFLDNAATPNLVVSMDPSITQEAFDRLREKIESGHAGTENAFKTMYLGGGSDVRVVGSNFEELAMKSVQGAGETRIAAAAGVPASILGISEGLAGSALNAGNYSAARRRFADGTIRPLWRSACGALQTLVPPADAGSRLWFDARDVSFLQEDVLDLADIQSRNALTIESLIRAGFVPSTAVTAVTTDDFTSLQHTGLYSVQLQPPTTSGA